MKKWRLSMGMAKEEQGTEGGGGRGRKGGGQGGQGGGVA